MFNVTRQMETPTTTAVLAATTALKTFHLPATLVAALEHDAAANHRSTTGQLSWLLAQHYEPSHRHAAMPVDVSA